MNEKSATDILADGLSLSVMFLVLLAVFGHSAIMGMIDFLCWLGANCAP